MAQTPRPVLVALLLQTFVTGIVDAASVLGLGHVFTANMTGNVVFLGFALAGAGSASVAASLCALASFLIGAVIGGRAVRAITAPTIRGAFAAEVIALAAATGLCVVELPAATYAIVALLALAMGIRNAVIRKLAVPDLTTTVLTLTVTGLAADSSLAGGTNPRWPRRVLAIAVMLGGAALGAIALRHGRAYAVGAAALIEAGAVIVLGRHAPALVPAPATTK